jgi:hypothetical protein
VEDASKNVMREVKSMRKRFVIVAAGLLLMGVGAVAYASIPGPDGVIHACYKNNNPAQGALIAIDSAASCPSGYTSLNWNQTGPQGPQGPGGISGYEVISAGYTVPDSGTTEFNIEVSCPSSKQALSGGGTLQLGTRDPAKYPMVVSQPMGVDPPVVGWNTRWAGPDDGGSAGIFVSGYAVCAYTN